MSESNTTKTPVGMTFVKKITMSLAHLRRMSAITDPSTGEILRPESAPAPIMRIRGVVTEGWEEASDFGEFVRWVGEFGAQVVNRDGSMSTVISRNLILPSVASDFLAMAMKPSQRETKTKGRTGTYFSAENDFGKVNFMVDIWLRAPLDASKSSGTGYEYEVRPIVSPEMALSIDSIGAGAAPLVAASVAEKLTLEAEKPVPEGKKPAEHEKAKAERSKA